MSFIRNKIYGNLNLLGIDVPKMKLFVSGLSLYLKDKKEISKQKANNSQFPFGSNRPIFEDRFAESGSASGHYFHQDLLVARKIFENKPVRHVDIGQDKVHLDPVESTEPLKAIPGLGNFVENESRLSQRAGNNFPHG